MSTNIEWTDETWNPVSGCSKVSQGCKHCYAERMWARLSRPNMPYHGRAFTDVRCHPDRLDQPLRWKKPRKIFVNSMSDLFHEDVPDDFIDRVFAVMALAKRHTFQILTKRPARMLEYMNEKWQPAPAREIAGITIPAETEGDTRADMVETACEEFIEKFNLCDPDIDSLYDSNGSCLANKWQWPLHNVWLGVSVEDQETADERIPLLLQTPAAVRFLSCEPLLGRLNLSTRDGEIKWIEHLPAAYHFTWLDQPYGLDWVIVGGESGPAARPMHPDWARDIRDQCQATGVPFFFKQWGEWKTTYDRDKDDPDWSRCPKAANNNQRYLNLVGGHGFHGDRVVFVHKVGKRNAGRTLDGRTWDDFPR